jgi:hypothetical protein
MAAERDVEVGVYVHLHDLDAALEDAKDLAWEHSVSGSEMLDLAVGSDEHVKLYHVLSERYVHSVDHMLFFMQNSLTLLAGLFETGHIKLNTDNGPLTDAEVCHNLSHLAQLICSSYMWLSAGYETLWPVNEDMGETVGTRFYFTEDEIKFEEN